MSKSILVVGSLAFDSIKTPAGSVEKALGGSANYFSLSSSYFTDVKLVGVVGEDFPTSHLDVLKSRGVDIEGVQTAAGKTFHWSGEYTGDMNEAKTLTTQLNVFEHFDPQLPESYKEAEYLFLGNIAPQLQMSVLDQVASPRVIALDSMNFWITGSRDALLEVLPKTDLLIINDGEAKLLGEHENLIMASETILKLGPKALVIKRGEYGAFLFKDGDVFTAPAMPIRQVVDPTGAGDTFAGGLMGYLAKSNAGLGDWNSLKKAVLHGIVMASFTVQDFGFQRLELLTADDIESTYEELIKIMTV